MPRLRALFAALLLAALFVPGAATAQTAPTPTATCGLTDPAFCDPLDAAFPANSRSGQLDSVVWGVSRTNLENPGQGQLDAWAATNLVCGSGTQDVVMPPSDVQICAFNGQKMLTEGQTDYGNVSNLSMYPRQPFDFAGRTGKATFDVSDDTQGGHMAWPVWQITDQPVPAPHSNVNRAKDALPRNGFGFALDNAQAGCVTVGEMWQVGNYVLTELPYTVDGCVLQPAGPGVNNHFEVDISQTGVKIFGTDAGTTAPLKQIAHISGIHLTLTRGLVWLQDVHYNGNKEPGSQGTHTFTWANVGFDGPALARDEGIDYPDACSPSCTPNSAGLANLGYTLPAGSSGMALSFPGATNSAQATGGLLVFSYDRNYQTPSFSYTVNGHAAHTFAWPYGGATLSGPWQDAALPIPASELRDGTNIVVLTEDAQYGIVVANIDLILAGAGGGVSATPTPSPTPTTFSATGTETTPINRTFQMTCTETGTDTTTIRCSGTGN